MKLSIDYINLLGESINEIGNILFIPTYSRSNEWYLEPFDRTKMLKRYQKNRNKKIIPVLEKWQLKYSSYNNFYNSNISY